MWKKNKWLIQILVFALVIGLTVYGLFRNSDLASVWAFICSARWQWLIPSVFLVLLFITGESLILHVIMKTLNTRHRPAHCVLYSFIGFFYSCITPSAGGGQPMQILYMKRDGISSAVTVPMLILVTIAYKAVLVIGALILLIFRPARIMTALEPIHFWYVLGVILTTGFISLYLILIFFPVLARKLGTVLFWITKHFLKPQKQKAFEDRITGWTSRYQEASRCMHKHRFLLPLVVLLSIIQRCFLFAVTYFTLRAFGITSVSFVTVLLLQCSISLSSDLLPLPGGTGANEALFLSIYTPLLGETAVLPVLVVSRGISYYSQLMICAVMTAASSFLIGKDAK